MKPKLTLLCFKSFRLFWVLFPILTGVRVLAASCCGGGFSLPSLIAGDDKAQLTSSYSFSEVVVGSVDSQGIWRRWEPHQKIQSLKIEGAHIFWDRFQFGFSLPLSQRDYDSTIYSGLGDITTSLGYEYLPDWNYNPWRPKGIGFIQITLPTGKSPLNSMGGFDSFGGGFWTLSLGTWLSKTWIFLDSFASLGIHHSFPGEFSTLLFSGNIEPGYGGHFQWGLGYNRGDYRLGSSILWAYEDPGKRTSTSGLVTHSPLERSATGILSLSSLFNSEWSGTLSYMDQTLFGSPLNTSLTKGISLQVQRHWER